MKKRHNNFILLALIINLGISQNIFSQITSRIGRGTTYVPGRENFIDSIKTLLRYDESGKFVDGEQNTYYSNGKAFRTEQHYKGYPTDKEKGFYYDGSLWFETFALDTLNIFDSILGYYPNGKIQYRYVSGYKYDTIPLERLTNNRRSNSIFFSPGVCNKQGADAALEDPFPHFMGTLTCYYENGNLKKEIICDDPDSTNSAKYWKYFSDKRKSSGDYYYEGPYPFIVSHCFQREYYENGNMKSWASFTWCNYVGRRASEYVTWDSTGNLRLNDRFSDQPDSLGNREYFFYYYPSGKIMWEGKYSNFNGDVLRADFEKRIPIEYDGGRFGEMKKYDEQGKQIASWR